MALFAKSPTPGRVKTRLTPPLSEAEAARVARACLEATIETLVPAARTARWTLFLDGPEEPWITALARANGMRVAPQSGEDLGARLKAAFRALRDEGAGRVIALGTDSPTLPPARILEAVSALAASDVVLGPTEDGGYYLVGSRGPGAEEAIFRDIPWSTERVLAMTLARAAESGLSVSLLPAWYDVDDLEDLLRLEEDVTRGGDSTGRLLALLDSVRGKLPRRSAGERRP